MQKLTDEQKRLAEEHLALVGYVLKKTGFFSQDPAVGRDDLFQIGVTGLIKAAQRYNGENSFSGYAYVCIWREMAMYLRRQRMRMRKGLIGGTSFDGLENVLGGTTEKRYQPEGGLIPYLQRMDPVTRKVLLREIGQVQAAQVLGCSQTYVSKLVRRHRNKIKEMIRSESV